MLIESKVKHDIKKKPKAVILLYPELRDDSSTDIEPLYCSAATGVGKNTQTIRK